MAKSKDKNTTNVGETFTGQKERDAIHIAVAPVVATCKLYPGQHIGFTDENTIELVSGAARKQIGIVDPFLDAPVYEGERFWMFLYPQTITSLKHNWTHPAFEGKDKPTLFASESAMVSAAKQQIADLAKEMGGDGGDEYYGPYRPMTYERLMAAAEDWLQNDEYHVQQGSESWREEFPDNLSRFWELYEIVTGKKVPEKKKGENFFSCTC